jgi:hypothetical protein
MVCYQSRTVPQVVLLANYHKIECDASRRKLWWVAWSIAVTAGLMTLDAYGFDTVQCQPSKFVQLACDLSAAHSCQNKEGNVESKGRCSRPGSALLRLSDIATDR